MCKHNDIKVSVIMIKVQQKHDSNPMKHRNGQQTQTQTLLII